jgi:CPA2 family monovalent cation:H+ antiporter-2
MASMFMVSSSAVIAKIIGELKLTHEAYAQRTLAITVMEDVVAVVMLTVLASQTQGAAGGGTSVGALLATMSAFVVLLVGAGLLLVPRLFRRLEARADPELQAIVVAGVLFLLALCAAKAGYSLALGAFLLGAIVAEMPQKTGIEKSFAGLRDIFSSVFFVSIGMMIEVRLLLEVWGWILGLSVFVMVARPLAT